jgi:alpha-1,3-glucosyltransferase
VGRFVALGAVTVAVFAVSLGPVVATGQGAALLARLFPFRRGLLHAYWAANVWALYAAADRALLAAVRVLAPAALPAVPGALTRGLVGDTAFAMLPAISPTTTFVLTVLAILVCGCLERDGVGARAHTRGGARQPSLVALWRRPTPPNFVLQVAVGALTAFLFGWHVHEKAILTTLLPLGCVARALMWPLWVRSRGD